MDSLRAWLGIGLLPLISACGGWSADPVLAVGTQRQGALALERCGIDYALVQAWTGGFQAEVTITNRGASEYRGWVLTWTSPEGQRVRDLWNGKASQEGVRVSVTSESWNSVLARGASTSIGFVADGDGSGVPGDFAIDGVRCRIGGAKEPSGENPAADQQPSAEGPKPVHSADLRWSNEGPISGLACVAWNEALDPHTWQDNYLCATEDLGLRFSTQGPIGGMQCLLVNEPSDPFTWQDNYLCAPRDYGFRWSYEGPIPGMKCLLVNEPSDPHTWQDNYLCWIGSDDSGEVPKVPGAPAGTVVQKNGQLQIQNGRLCNQAGSPIQLKGMSSHGLQWFGSLVNADVLRWLRDDWRASVFRAAMYTAEGGYIQNPSVKGKVKEAIEAAIALGVYVVVDWHILKDPDPQTYKEQAKAFFEEMASQYGRYPNIIYEICNEPNGGVTWRDSIKPYAEELIAAIRAKDPDNLIIVGTPNYSTGLLSAAEDPLELSNIMYTLHFYSEWDGQGQRNNVDELMRRGMAVFVTEWGTSGGSGDGGPYLDEAGRWIDFLHDRQISWTNWSLSTANETSAALKPGASAHGGWTDQHLSTSGRFVRARMRERGKEIESIKK